MVRVAILFSGCMNETGFNKSDLKVVSCVDFIKKNLQRIVRHLDIMDPRQAATAHLSHLDALDKIFEENEFFILLLSK